MNRLRGNDESSPFKHGKILIVDDREENLFALKALLADQCAQITCVNSGNEALSLLLKGNLFSLILLDVQMPGLDGFETLSLMKKHPKTCDIPVIFITAIHKDEKYLHLGFDTGAVDYICKPIDPELICSKVAVFLNLESNRQKLKNDLKNAVDLENANKTILEYSAQGIISVDEFGFIDFANPSALQFLNYSADQLIKKHILKVISPEISYLDHWSHTSYYKAIQDSGQVTENNIHLYDSSGNSLCVDLSFGSYREQAARGGVFIFQDISERKKKEEALLFMATHDALTQLPNKLMFRETLINAISRAKRYEYDLYIMFIDLDHFKSINDGLGHYAGDSLLRDVGQRLISAGRDVDVFARIGGDEFAVMFEDDNRSFEADMVAAKLLSTLKQPFHFNNLEMYVSASIGIVKYPDYGKNADDLIQAADVAMSRAKQSGRNSFEHFDAHSQVEVVNRLELEYDLKQALSNQEILCFFQPVVYADGKIHAMEVLIRWQHPILGMLKPKDFLELAENTGIISELSYQVFVMAFRQLHQWQEQKLCQLDFKLSFNLSSRQFFRKSIIEDILRLKKEQHVNVKNMILEFTESTLTRDSDGISSVLNELKSMGIELALDSYGSGYSSLHLLASLPLDYLKIDQSFVKEIKFVNQSIIETTLKFANSMSMKVVAVGVETDQQFSNLAASGIDFLQGDFISAATGSEETTNRLKKQLGNLPLKPVNSISNIK